MPNNPNIQIAKEIEKCISEVISIHDNWLSKNASYQSIYHALTKLGSRSREYTNPSFVVLVVGPVKAGKSTFVNLVANNYVSPTHFLECTIKPSIISAGKNEKITIYRSTDRSDSARQMDDILDCLNGLIEKDSVVDVHTTEVELTKDNIDNYVKGSVRADDDMILTSITTDGGKLIQENVFLVDMPGFDGSKANLDKVYETIVKRADLLIFVQSSNSAISKVSSEFFDFVKMHNTSAPICLIHNVFEAAYWRPQNMLNEDIEYQKNYAIQAIQLKGLSISESNSFNLNLGMVSDKRSGKFESHNDRLLEEEAKFTDAETKMFELFKTRESIRISNCITRTDIQKNTLVSQINDAINTIDANIQAYRDIEKEFDDLKLNHWPNDNVDINNAEPGADEKVLLEKTSIDRSHLVDNILEVEYDKAKKRLRGRWYTCSASRQFAQNFLSSVLSKLNGYLNSKVSECKQLVNFESIKKVLNDVTSKSAKYGIVDHLQINTVIPKCEIDFKPEIDIQEIIPLTVLLYGVQKVKGHLTRIYKNLKGDELEITKRFIPGYIPTEVYNNMESIRMNVIHECKAQIIKDINSEIERIKQSVLKAVGDVVTLEKEKKNLEELKNDLNQLYIQIYE